jgi:hypothetical protein
LKIRDGKDAFADSSVFIPSSPFFILIPGDHFFLLLFDGVSQETVEGKSQISIFLKSK